MPLLDPSGAQLRLGVSVAIFGSAALGLTIIWGLAGQPSFGHAALVGVGAYTVAILTVDHGADVWLALVLAGAGGGLASLVMGLCALRVRADVLALVTFALGEGTRVVERNSGFTHAGDGIPGVPGLPFGGRSLVTSADLYRPALVLVGVAYVVCRVLRSSAAGAAMLAVGSDEEAARTLGIRPAPVKLLAFLLGGVLTGIAGGFFAVFSGFVSSTSFGVVASFQLVVMVILGGLGNFEGAIVGAFVVELIDDRLQAYPDPRLAITGLAMILVVLARSGALRAGYASARGWVRRIRRRPSLEGA